MATSQNCQRSRVGKALGIRLMERTRWVQLRCKLLLLLLRLLIVVMRCGTRQEPCMCVLQYYTAAVLYPEHTAVHIRDSVLSTQNAQSTAAPGKHARQLGGLGTLCLLDAATGVWMNRLIYESPQPTGYNTDYIILITCVQPKPQKSRLKNEGYTQPHTLLASTLSLGLTSLATLPTGTRSPPQLALFLSLGRWKSGARLGR